jgi:hypothetical protein
LLLAWKPRGGRLKHEEIAELVHDGKLMTHKLAEWY